MADFASLCFAQPCSRCQSAHPVTAKHHIQKAVKSLFIVNLTPPASKKQSAPGLTQLLEPKKTTSGRSRLWVAWLLAEKGRLSVHWQTSLLGQTRRHSQQAKQLLSREARQVLELAACSRLSDTLSQATCSVNTRSARKLFRFAGAVMSSQHRHRKLTSDYVNAGRVSRTVRQSRTLQRCTCYGVQDWIKWRCPSVHLHLNTPSGELRPSVEKRANVLTIAVPCPRFCANATDSAPSSFFFIRHAWVAATSQSLTNCMSLNNDPHGRGCTVSTCEQAGFQKLWSQSLSIFVGAVS